MIQLNIEFLTQIQQNAQKARDDFANAVQYIKKSSAVFSGGQLQLNIIPKIFDSVAYHKLEQDMLVFDTILDKVIEQYLVDSQFRQLFGFDKELERLIMLDSGYGRKLPIARIDIFFDESNFDFKFCELNADGASAMNEDREIGNAFGDSFLWKSCFGDKNLKRFELFDSWVLEFGKLYTEWLTNKGLTQPVSPRLAIVDFLDIGTKSEFEVFRQAFARHGYDAVVVDITRIQFDGYRMYDEQGVAIDAIYRRAVTSECMQKLASIQPFVQGITAGAVCLVGHFRTQVVHDKNLFRILRHPYTRNLFTPEQNMFVDRHVPFTVGLRTGAFDYNDVVANKDRWLIKPSDRYGSNGVVAGRDCSADKFGELIRDNIDSDYILQEYCTPFKTTNIYFNSNGVPHTKPYGNMTGIFLYNGRVAGLYTRQMSGSVTTQQDVGRVVTSVVVLEEGESTVYKPSQYQPQYKTIQQSTQTDNIVAQPSVVQPIQSSISQDVAAPLVQIATPALQSNDIEIVSDAQINQDLQVVDQSLHDKELAQQDIDLAYLSQDGITEDELSQSIEQRHEDLQMQEQQKHNTQAIQQDEEEFQLVDAQDTQPEELKIVEIEQVDTNLDFDIVNVDGDLLELSQQDHVLSAEEQTKLLLQQLESSLFEIDTEEEV
ncbi:MAG: hypothetical protein LBK70_00595 [Clostridiales bacterium]|jgi:hypothetical protein|nr:hypothetical protein [Clostridiales bacterium]